MKKKSDTEKQTNKLLTILGENPKRKVRRLLTVTFVVTTAVFLTYRYKSTEIKNTKNENRICENLRWSFFEKKFSGEAISVEFKQDYLKCASKYSYDSKEDSLKLCQDSFKNRYWGEFPKVSKRKAPYVDKFLHGCRKLIRDRIPRMESYLVDVLTETKEVISEYEERGNSSDKAIQAQIRTLKSKENDFKERLLAIKKLKVD